MIGSKIPDCACWMKTAVNAVEASKDEDYPNPATVNDAVYDTRDGKLRLWTGSKWQCLCTSQATG